MSLKVSIYSTPTCHFCEKAKELFKENKIKYSEYDVKSDLKRRKEMIEKSGQMRVPVIIIDGEVLVGFDSYTVKERLGIKS